MDGNLGISSSSEASAGENEEARESSEPMSACRMLGVDLHSFLLPLRLLLPSRPRSCHQSVQLPHYQREELHARNLLSPLGHRDPG